MVQRAFTFLTSDSVVEIALGGLYSEQAAAGGITTEKADLTVASLPYRIIADFQKPISDAMRLRDKDLYDRLEKAGFQLDFGDDDSGQFMKYLRRGGGFYIDVGASDLICDGSIKLCHGGVERLTEESVILTDGTELPADRCVRHRLQVDEQLCGGHHRSRRGQSRQGMGLRLGHHTRPGAVGRRVAQHVEADPAGESVVPRR